MQDEKKIDTKINFRSVSFKKYFLNTSWLLFEKVVRLILNFFVTIAIIRYLGPDQFGLYSYAISFYGLFVAFVSLGLESISIRELVKHPEQRDEILGSVFYTQLLGAVITISLIALTLLITSEALLTSVLILIISVSSFFQTFNVIDYYFRSTVKAKYSVYVLFTSVLLVSLIKFALIIIKAPLIYFIIAFALEFVFNAIGYFIVYHLQKLKIVQWKFDKELAISLLKDSWPLILSGVVVSIYMKVDQVLIKNMLDVKEVGYYAAAVRLSESWYFIPVAISNALFPAIVNAKNISRELYLTRLQKLYDILAWIAIGISIPVSFFSAEIINLLYGSKYLSSAPILTIYIWAGAAVFLGVASSQYLVTENLTKISLMRTSLGMIANVILNIIFIPQYGIVGSAVATLISYTLATFSIIFFKDTSHQFVMMLKSIFLINLIPSFKSLWHSR
ncbi:MAG TPA: flippase [Ignavibacteriaceae bacterium]|nr:flippase [Ignavibacteriaceae bacterium]